MAKQQQEKLAMPYIRLGNSGLKVSRIILGTMTYGSPGWKDWLQSEEVATEHIKYAYGYDAGVQTFDTADVYSNGLSEIILGNCIKKLALPRENIVILTKICGIVGSDLNGPVVHPSLKNDEMGYVNQYGLSRKHIFHGVQNSLKRLQLDYIDVLQCHRFDPFTPIEETMQALHDVVKAGYVRYIGMSSCSAWQFHAMQNYAIQANLTPFISMQNHYNVVYREEEREMMPTLKMFGVGSIPWSPLARGLVTRPLSNSQGTARSSDDPFLAQYLKAGGTVEILNRIEELSQKKSVSMAQISVAWSLTKVTAPIVGTTSMKSLQDTIAGVHVKLSPEEVAYLDEPYKTQEILGH